jgi:hypothetical protein
MGRKRKIKEYDLKVEIVFGGIPFEAIDEGELRYMTFNLIEGMAKYYTDHFEEYLQFLPKKKR